jgi:sigma-54 specific flagellar transcriptional regulator A
MRCNVRIIAATHRNLEESITRGTFREDLFHRLNVFPIEMPALSARIDDLPLLVRDFIAHNIAEGRGHVQLAPRAIAALSLYRWPGNVRELANLIERLSIVCSGKTAGIGDLPAKYRPTDWREPAPTEPLDDTNIYRVLESAENDVVPAPATQQLQDIRADDGETELSTLPDGGIDLRAHLMDIERKLVTQALDRSSGVVAHAARLLNLRRTTLVEKLRKLGLESGELATED